jgi:aspartate kinase
MTQPVVLKFGGTSVADAGALERVMAIVRERSGGGAVVVVSAMAGVTDALVTAARRAVAGEVLETFRELSFHIRRHHEVATALLSADIARRQIELVDGGAAELRDLLDRLARSPAESAALGDRVAAFGEQLSGNLLAAALSARGASARYVDPRRCIATDDRHGRASPILSETERRTRAELEPLLAQGIVPVLGGFIGASPSGATTTLGRGGSDYTASLVGAALGAREIQVWTDVPGVLTADPRIVADARTIPVLSYDEAAELSYFGAKVLHPKTMRPARDRGIPVRILSSLAPDLPGTLVTGDAHIWPGTVKAIAHRTGITVVQVASGRMLGAHGFLRALFEVFDRHETSVDVVATSEVSVSLTVEDDGSLPRIVEELRGLGEVTVEPHRAIVCIVGEGLRTTPGIAARVFRTIPHINVSLISQGASLVNLTFVIDEPQVRDAVVRLHAALLEDGEPREVPPLRTAARRTNKGLDVVHLTRDLIDIPSVTGDEPEVVDFVAGLLTKLGYRVEQFDAAPGRPNLLARTSREPRVVLCTHLDTVPPHIPSHEDEEWVYGRGACDAKGVAAAQILAAQRLRAAGIEDLGILLVADEELASLGARAANAHPRARESRFVIVGEPTDNRLAVGSRGSLQFRLRATGPGGHAGIGDASTSAVHKLMEALTALRAAPWPSDPFFGRTTVNVGVIAGGTRPNILAAEAHADVQIRLVTPADPIRALVEDAVGDRARIEYGSITPPIRLATVPDFETCVVGFTTDVPHLSNWGAGLLLGPGSIAYAHTPEERIDKSELRRGVELYVALVRSLLASPPAAPAATTGAADRA